MKRWIALVAKLYPRSWREEFGEEFDALLDDVRPRWRVFVDILGGAIAMQLTERSNGLKLVASTAIAGTILAWGLSFRTPPQYVSSAKVSVTPQPDPVRPTSPEALRQRAAGHAAEMETRILSRVELFALIDDPNLELYKEERKKKPLEDVIEQMRHDIRIQARPSTEEGPIVFNISFSYPDQVKAKAVVQALANKFTEENSNITRTDIAAYRGFWGDMSLINHSKPAPPPPVGEVVSVLDSASLPAESVTPSRMAFLAGGLGAGLLFGLLSIFATRWPQASRQVAAFALAGCLRRAQYRS